MKCVMKMGREVGFHGASLREIIEYKFIRLYRESNDVDMCP